MMCEEQWISTYVYSYDFHTGQTIEHFQPLQWPKEILTRCFEALTTFTLNQDRDDRSQYYCHAIHTRWILLCVGATYLGDNLSHHTGRRRGVPWKPSLSILILEPPMLMTGNSKTLKKCALNQTKVPSLDCAPFSKLGLFIITTTSHWVLSPMPDFTYLALIPTVTLWSKWHYHYFMWTLTEVTSCPSPHS